MNNFIGTLLIPAILALLCLGLPCLILAKFLWDCWKVSRQHDKEQDL